MQHSLVMFVSARPSQNLQMVLCNILGENHVNFLSVPKEGRKLTQVAMNGVVHHVRNMETL